MYDATVRLQPPVYRMVHQHVTMVDWVVEQHDYQTTQS